MDLIQLYLIDENCLLILILDKWYSYCYSPAWPEKGKTAATQWRKAQDPYKKDGRAAKANYNCRWRLGFIPKKRKQPHRLEKPRFFFWEFLAYRQNHVQFFYVCVWGFNGASRFPKGFVLVGRCLMQTTIYYREEDQYLIDKLEEKANRERKSRKRLHPTIWRNTSRRKTG